MKPNYFSMPDPCSEDWNKMTPTEQGAFCYKCQKEVINLSNTAPDKIKDLVAEKNNPCIRILQSQIDEMNLIELLQFDRPESEIWPHPNKFNI